MGVSTLSSYPHRARQSQGFLLHLTNRKRMEPVSLSEWNSLPPLQLRRRIFRGGLSPGIRKYAWKYLLGFYQSTTTPVHERVELYNERKSQLFAFKVPDSGSELYSRIKRVCILKSHWQDVVRTDACLPFYREHPENADTLQLILLIWSTHFSGTVGYVQGMSDLASIFVQVSSHFLIPW